MKKTLVFGFALAFSITPLSAFAAVNSINGLTAADQSLVSPNSGATNTMHMHIVTVGTDTHRFKWDGTPWCVDQGGTGNNHFTPGALIFGNGTGQLATTTPATVGQILQFNGTLPTWVSTSSLGIVAQAAGSNGEIQFNDSGMIGADSRFVWNSNAYFGLGALIVRRMFGTDDTNQDGGPLAGQVYLYNPATTTTSVHGGDATVQGADVSAVSDVSVYTGGLSGGSASLESGGIQTTLGGGASGGGVNIFPGTWDSGSGWRGGDIFIFGGQAVNDSNGNYPVTQGRVTFQSGGHDFVFLDNAAGTFGILQADQTWTGNNTFSKGTAATTSVNFGEMGDATSHVCFNTKNTDGQDISFYFVGTSMVVENNACQ